MSKHGGKAARTTKVVVPVEKKGYGAGQVRPSEIVLPAEAQGPCAGTAPPREPAPSNQSSDGTGSSSK